MINATKGKNELYRHPDKNMVTIRCTSAGYCTEDTKKGGYLIQTVNDILRDDMMVKHNDLERLASKIARRTNEKTKYKNCAEYTASFDRDFYLKPIKHPL